jgi:hypothetical protein
MLMGVSDIEIGYKSSLLRMERLADEVGQHLARLEASSAA